MRIFAFPLPYHILLSVWGTFTYLQQYSSQPSFYSLPFLTSSPVCINCFKTSFSQSICQHAAVWDLLSTCSLSSPRFTNENTNKHQKRPLWSPSCLLNVSISIYYGKTLLARRKNQAGLQSITNISWHTDTFVDVFIYTYVDILQQSCLNATVLPELAKG